MTALRAPRDPSPLQGVAAGLFGEPEVLNQGAAAAAGKITFANLTDIDAGETVTINGVVFTCVASGATGNQFNVDSTLTLTLDALVTALNASTDPKVAVATYAKSGSTIVTVTYDTNGGMGMTLAASKGVVTAMAGGGTADPISLDTETTIIDLAQAQNQAFVLPNGAEGQQKTIFLRTKSGTGAAVISGLFAASNTTLTLDTAAEMATLRFLGGRWRVIANTGALS